ncbi:rhamnulokinase [Thermoactinospora rubra]|uniref:rhamnulokinase n=1 Tax=Thermoactinospora rubra TaxID=1088767 RepID=UPI000A115E0F|nr:rhamnulokinase family protein [Thermoactinospora rubra]
MSGGLPGGGARYAAVDLGASSGRVIVAEVGPERLELREVHRFGNVPVERDGTLWWDFGRILDGIATGLRAAGPVDGIGVDSWAVDFGLLDASGTRVGDPVCYRDRRTEGVPERVDAVIPAEELYARTGIARQPFNTLYQLVAAPPPAGRTLLLIPDLVAHWLTGQVGVEVTNASTTQLLEARTRQWDAELMSRVGIDPGLFPPLRSPGEVIGRVRPELAARFGWSESPPVIAVGSHDTASAVAAVPAEDPHFAYISCGTWSLVGVELDKPAISEEGRRASFTNEAGIDGTVRYLRNVTGLWLLQECLREWGSGAGLADLLRQAAELPRGAVVDAGDPEFLPPGGMPRRIAEHCRRSGRQVPATRAETVRCILDSLAVGHRAAVEDAVRLTGRAVDVVHIVGGGSRNELLCRLTAQACGLPVVAGPVEATAIGNALVQARATGALEGTLRDLRALVRRTQPLTRYPPS